MKGDYMSYLVKNNVRCNYCTYSIVHNGERYWKRGNKVNARTGEPIRYPLYLHFTCGKELYAKGENLWLWGKKDSPKSKISKSRFRNLRLFS